MKKLLGTLLVLALLPAAIAVKAEPVSGERSFTVSGTGASDKDFDANTYGVSLELGYYQTERLLWGLRQSVNGAGGDEIKNSWNGATRGFVDYHFLDREWRPYIGLNLGGIYGENVKNTGTAGVEAGLRYFVLEKTFINFGIEYNFLFEDGDDVDDNYDDGAYFYTLGVGFNF